MKTVEEIKNTIFKLKDNLEERQLRLIVYAAVGLLMLLVVLLAHRPLAGELRNAQRKLHALQTQLADQRMVIDSLKEAGLLLNLMKQDQVSMAIDNITEFGRNLDIKFVSITPDEIEKSAEGDFMVLPIGFKIECAYESLGHLLEYLERFPRTVAAVGDVSIRPIGTMAQIEAKLLVDLYMEAQ